MKVTTLISMTVYLIIISIPTVVSGHPGHGSISAPELLHNVLHHSISYYALMFLGVLLVGLRLRHYFITKK